MKKMSRISGLITESSRFMITNHPVRTVGGIMVLTVCVIVSSGALWTRFLMALGIVLVTLVVASLLLRAGIGKK
jgi:hypothetical protein